MVSVKDSVSGNGLRFRGSFANTGLLDCGARFYDPYVARWTAVDPMADKYPDTCDDWEGNIMAEEVGYGIVEPRNLEEALSSPVKAFLTGKKEYKIRKDD